LSEIGDKVTSQLERDYRGYADWCKSMGYAAAPLERWARVSYTKVDYSRPAEKGKPESIRGRRLDPAREIAAL
jgi:hypothetical protein